MKKLHQSQQRPTPQVDSVAQGGSSGKSNAMLVNQLQTLSRESAVSAPTVPVVNTG